MWKAYTSHDGWEKLVVFWSNSRNVVVGFVSLSWFFLFIYFFIYEEKARMLYFQAGRSLATRSLMSDLTE